MLYSQGITLEQLGLQNPNADRRAAWKLFASNYHLFRGTPSRLWLDHVFATVFGFDRKLDAGTADDYYDRINAALATPAFNPRALFPRFNISLLSTSPSPRAGLLARMQ